MMDEYNTIAGGYFPGVITSKPVGAGGSLGRTQATGYGVIYVLKDLLEAEKIDIKSTTASIQGVGNVAEYAARLYAELGGKIVTISCRNSLDEEPFTLRKTSGCDIDELFTIRKGWGIDQDKAKGLGYEVLDENAWLREEVDILIPAALQNQITLEKFPLISKKVKIICEAANGPVTPDCDPLVQERGILLVPDFLANAGGVTCSYFEQVQNNMNYYWSLDEVLEKLNRAMSSAFRAVYDLSKEKGVYMRDAAYMIAIARVENAVKLRGWI
jgi:glutamate dehydrogenase (NAD(P)+)